MVASQKRKETAIKYEAQDFHLGFHTIEELDCLHILLLLLIIGLFDIYYLHCVKCFLEYYLF